MEWRGREWSGVEWRGGEGRGGQGRAGQSRVPDCLGGLSRVGISSRSTRPWNGQPPSNTYDRTHGNNKLFMSKKSFVLSHYDRHNSRTKHTQV